MNHSSLARGAGSSSLRTATIVAVMGGMLALLAWWAVGTAGAAAETGTGGGMSVLAWLADRIEDLVMILQDTIEGWTWA